MRASVCFILALSFYTHVLYLRDRPEVALYRWQDADSQELTFYSRAKGANGVFYWINKRRVDYVSLIILGIHTL